MHAFQAAIADFRRAVALQDFKLGHRHLDVLAALVAKAWPTLSGSERDQVHSEFMSALEWARFSVHANREQMRVESDRIHGAKVYQMPDPRIRWNMQG